MDATRPEDNQKPAARPRAKRGRKPKLEKPIVVSGYGWAAVVADEPEPFELFVPEELASHLQFRQSTTFTYSFATGDPVESSDGRREFYTKIALRPETGGNETSQNSFALTVRFKNEPGELRNFLTWAKSSDVDFQSIRTFGLRDTRDSDLVFAGKVNVAEAQTDQSVKKRFARAGRGRWKRVYSKKLEVASTKGYIGENIYELDLPVVGGRFVKFKMKAGWHDVGLSEKHPGGLAIVQIGADLSSGTLFVDTHFARLKHYLIQVDCPVLGHSLPITKCILESLSEDPQAAAAGPRRAINVDAISGTEYYNLEDLKNTPEVARILVSPSSLSGDAGPVPGAVLEILGTCQEELNEDLEKRRIEAGLGKLGLVGEILSNVVYGSGIRRRLSSVHRRTSCRQPVP